MTVQNGIVRPTQVQDKEHHISSVHKYVLPQEKPEDAPKAESIETYHISIKTIDPRLTDFLTRLVSGVLFTNGVSIQNAEENVLREMGKWNDDVAPATADITKEPTRPAVPAQKGGPVNTPGQGDGN